MGLASSYRHSGIEHRKPMPSVQQGIKIYTKNEFCGKIDNKLFLGVV
jgi:hypothetical protein